MMFRPSKRQLSDNMRTPGVYLSSLQETSFARCSSRIEDETTIASWILRDATKGGCWTSTVQHPLRVFFHWSELC